MGRFNVITLPTNVLHIAEGGNYKARAFERNNQQVNCKKVCIMKKGSLYFIYGLLFIIIGNTAEDRLVIGVAIICAVLSMILSLVLYYIEDKDKYN